MGYLRRERAMIKADIDGTERVVPLERIFKAKSGGSPAMVLTKKGWSEIYCVNFREGWDEDEYFELAEAIFEKQGIFKP